MNKAHRDHFLMAAVRARLSDWAALKLTRMAGTHHRLAEAQCNGDYPYNVQRGAEKACEVCDTGHNGRYRVCDTCRVERAIKALVAPFEGVAVEFQGDPRGWTVKVKGVK